MPDVRPLNLDGLFEVRPRRFADDRGFFSETWSEAGWAEAGIAARWVQDNHSLSRAAGTIRGLHYQLAPFAQDKLVRVVRGAIVDVAADIRRGSPTFGRWASVRLTATKGNQLYIPAGFAHGFVTLEPDCEVEYKVSAPYSLAHERSVRFDDPDLAIDWPIDGQPSLSVKDREAPLLRDQKDLM